MTLPLSGRLLLVVSLGSILVIVLFVSYISDIDVELYIIITKLADIMKISSNSASQTETGKTFKNTWVGDTL